MCGLTGFLIIKIMDPITNQFYYFIDSEGTKHKAWFNLGDIHTPMTEPGQEFITDVPYCYCYYDDNNNFQVSILMFFSNGQSNLSLTGSSTIGQNGQSYLKYIVNAQSGDNIRSFDVFNFEPLPDTQRQFISYNEFEIDWTIENGPFSQIKVSMFYACETYYCFPNNQSTEIWPYNPPAPVQGTYTSSLTIECARSNSNQVQYNMQTGTLEYNVPYIALIQHPVPTGMEYILCVAVFGNDEGRTYPVSWMMEQNDSSITDKINELNLTLNEWPNGATNKLAYGIYASPARNALDLEAWVVNVNFAGFAAAEPKRPPMKKTTVTLASGELTDPKFIKKID